MMKENELMWDRIKIRKRILRGNDQYLPITLTTLLAIYKISIAFFKREVYEIRYM